MRSIGAVAAMIVVLCVGDAWATTSQRVTRICPVCGGEVVAAEVCSTSTRGCDLDLRPRYMGASVLAIVPVTCSRCYYSGFLSDFRDEKGKGGPEISAALRERIVEGKVLKPRAPIEAGTPSPRIPSVLRQDLVWQTKKLLGAEARVLARAALTGSWLVREGAFLGHELPKEVTNRHQEWMRKLFRGAGASEMRDLMDLRTMAFFLALDRAIPADWARDQGTLAAMLTAAQTGEYRAALVLLGRIEDMLGAACSARFKARIEGLAADEALFQRRALEAFDGVKLDEIADPMARFDLLHLKNEVVRRLGDGERATRTAQELETQAKALEDPSPFVRLFAEISTGLARATAGKTGDELVEAYEKVLGKVTHPRAELAELEKVVTRLLEAQGIARRSWLR